MSTSMFTRLGAMLLMIAALAVGVAACGDDSSDDSTSASDEKPVAEIADLSGVDTSVALDPGFLDALEQLKVTPAPSGDATLKGTDISFPITGGNVSLYNESRGSDIDPTPVVATLGIVDRLDRRLEKVEGWIAFDPDEPRNHEEKCSILERQIEVLTAINNWLFAEVSMIEAAERAEKEVCHA